MATIEQYQSGWVERSSKLAVDLMQSATGPILETEYGPEILKQIQLFAPLRVSEKQAFEFIDNARLCAVGERTCRCNYENAPYTESVFLNELAQAVVEMGKARWVDKAEAKSTLGKYPGHPIVISKVSGSYMEICRSWPRKCIYWNMEKHKVRCVNRVNRMPEVVLSDL